MRHEFPVRIAETGAPAKRDATLVVGLTLDEVDEAVALWSPFLRSRIKTGRRPEHAHWDWSRKSRDVKGFVSYVLVGIIADGEMQAMMLWEEVLSRARHPVQLGKGLIYVPFLSTAPWNDREIVQPPRFRGLGSLLLTAALERSTDLEYKGRLGLHSLPQAEAFYKKCGMIDLGVDQDHERLHYFEFTPELAREFSITKTGGNP